MPSKTTLIRAGIALVVLVAAIVTGSLFAQSKRPPTPKPIQLSAEQQSAADYDKAIAALSKEDTAAAVVLLQRAVTLDRNNTRAVTKLSEIKKTTTPSTPTPQTPAAPATKTPDPNAPNPFLGPIDVKKLLPKTMEGFSLGLAQVIDTDATVAGEPNVANSVVSNIIWAVHDRGSEAKAQQFVDGLNSGLYPQDAASVNIRGATGVFGTDGTHFASVAYRRGRYAFEVILTTSGPPVNAKTLAEKAAAAFPTAP